MINKQINSNNYRENFHSHAPCFLCGSTGFLIDPRFSPDNWGLKRCDSCGLVYTHPIPNTETHLAENEEKYGKPFLEMQARSLNNNRKVHFKVLSEIERDSKLDGRRLLDIGCGAGQFLHSAIDGGWQAEGVELNKENAAMVEKQGLSVFQGTLEGAQFPDAAFDVVTLWDILEHIPDPIAFLNEVQRILKPSGLVFLQSPNIESDIADIWGNRWPWLCLPDHLYHFSPLTIDELFKKTGFSVLRTYTWESTLVRVKTVANKRPGASKPEKAIRSVLGLLPIFMMRLLVRNSDRMGLVRMLAYKEGE